MKKIYRILAIFLIAVSFFSCEDDEKNQSIEVINAPWVYFQEITTPVLDVTDLENSSYQATVVNPFNNVVSYEIRVNLNNEEDTNGDLVLSTLTTITDFPANLDLSATAIADALGITTNDFSPGDQINFRVIATDDQGISFDGADETQFLGDINNPGLEQALSFRTFVSCPFNAQEAAGTYNVSFHRFDRFFGPQPATREVVAGPGPNQITIIGGPIPLDGSDDLIISVDPDTGIASYGGPSGQIHFNTFGPGTYAGVGGFVFSCTGTIDISILSSGFIDNFLVMSK